MMTSSVQKSLDENGVNEQQKQVQPDVQNLPTASAILPSGIPPPPAEYMISQGFEAGQTVAAYPYPDPYYGAVVAAYGGQAVMLPHLIGVHPTGVQLPTDAAEGPVYVNAKQYHGIMRRRQSRAKAESVNKPVKSRKPYLHESRHLHAIKRARGSGGRFTSKGEENKEDGVLPDSNQTKPGNVGDSNVSSKQQSISVPSYEKSHPVEDSDDAPLENSILEAHED